MCAVPLSEQQLCMSHLLLVLCAIIWLRNVSRNCLWSPRPRNLNSPATLLPTSGVSREIFLFSLFSFYINFTTMVNVVLDIFIYYSYLFTFFNTYAYNSNDYFHIYMQMLNSSTLSLKDMHEIYIRWAIQYSDILPSFGCRGVQRFWPGRGGFPEEKKWGEPNYDRIMSLKMIS